MSFSDRYPLTKRNEVSRLRAVLSRVPGLSARQGEDLALAINDIADKAADLNDIFTQLICGDHAPEDLADLLSAFKLTIEQIRGGSDATHVRLHELSDRLRKHEATGTKRA